MPDARRFDGRLRIASPKPEQREDVIFSARSPQHSITPSLHQDHSIKITPYQKLIFYRNGP